MRFKLIRTSDQYSRTKRMITVEPKTVDDIMKIMENTIHPIIIHPERTYVGCKKSFPTIEIYDDYRE